MVKKKTNLALYALIGYPLGHSFSPAMQNAGFAARNIAAQYCTVPVPPGKIKTFVAALPHLPFAGYNVTVPYKEVVMPALDRCAEEVEVIGAVNTIVREKRVLTGHNTDWRGFVDSLRVDLSFSPRGKAAVILGAGGAGKACLYGLCKAGVTHVTIADTDYAKACRLKEKITVYFPDISFAVISPQAVAQKKFLRSFDLLVNTTPCGMRSTDPQLIPLRCLAGLRVRVYDVIYNPKETTLIKTARRAGLHCSNGLGMLLYQGTRAFECWTGEKAPVAAMKKALYAQAG